MKISEKSYFYAQSKVMSQEVFSKIDDLLTEIEKSAPKTTEALEAFRIQYLGSKNVIKPLFAQMKSVEPSDRKSFGLKLNALKEAAQRKYDYSKNTLVQTGVGVEVPTDLSIPPVPYPYGTKHPVRIVMNRIIEIFTSMGFAVVENREIEDEWHNFTALNTPEDHPARDMTDTYYLKHDHSHVLRSQTSTAQVHELENRQPPIRIISPGRVYRNETVSARSHCQFHQVEGLYVDEGVTFADMKQVLFQFARTMYGKDIKIRFRPSYFPFTEPSAEMDVYWGLNNEDDYRMTKGTGWLEIMGCGMVDPNVLDLCGIDSEKYTGFAFGMGIERQAMRKFKINDIRLLFENDLRFLRQFQGAH